MLLSNPEILLALRSPDSGWLGVLATVLDEANKDPRFDAAQREILCRLLEQRGMTREISDAARRRAASFETQIVRESRAPSAPREPVVRTAPQRPKLTLIGKMAC